MPVVLSDRAWEEIRRIVHDIRREWTSTKNSLASFGQRGTRDNDVASDHFPVPFRNDSGETIPAYAPMRVTGVDGIGAIQVITVAKPSSTFQRLYLVNGPTRVGDGFTSMGTWMSNAGFILYDDANTPAYGESWGPQSGSWEIKKYRYGFTIIGGATGGTTDAVGAMQYQVNHFWGQTSGAISKGSTGTVEIYDGNDTDTSMTVGSVKNKFANVADNKKVSVEWLGGSWYLKAAEC